LTRAERSVMETETRDTASTLLAYAVARASTNDDAPWWRFLLGQLRASRIDPACPPEAWERALADLTAGLDHVVATGRVPEDMGTAEQVVDIMSRAVLWTRFLYVRAEVDNAHGHPSITEERFRECIEYSRRFTRVFADIALLGRGLLHTAVFYLERIADLTGEASDWDAVTSCTDLLALPEFRAGARRSHALHPVDGCAYPVSGQCLAGLWRRPRWRRGRPRAECFWTRSPRFPKLMSTSLPGLSTNRPRSSSGC
jgi:hypothetical protein